VVAARGGALPEVVATGGGGIVVERDSPEAMARGLTELLAQPEARARFGERGRAGIVQHYSWPRIAAATAEIYAEAIEARRGRPASTTTSARAGSRRASASSA
jgi:glycosyltransferase involved in cell wall biosynthesis